MEKTNPFLDKNENTKSKRKNIYTCISFKHKVPLICMILCIVQALPRDWLIR